jgi:DNA-binding transcriptional LysR family regulator
MVNLAVAAEDAVRAANRDAELLRVVASANVADSVAPALLQAFARRASNVEATLGSATSGEMQALLAERLADVALGSPLAGPAAPGVVSEPLLRYRLLVVAGHAHPAHRAHLSSLAALRHEEWLVDPTAADPESELGRLLAHIGVPESNVRVFPTQPAAWASAAAGTGIAPAIEHLWIRDPHPDAAPLAVPGTPIELLWHVSMLEGDRCPAVARRLHRFLATSDATQAMYRADGGVPASRFRPPVYVTLWS